LLPVLFWRHFFTIKLFGWAPYKSSHPFYLPLLPSVSP
jgi:hypothetical protein